MSCLEPKLFTGVSCFRGGRVLVLRLWFLKGNKNEHSPHWGGHLTKATHMSDSDPHLANLCFRTSLVASKW